MASEQALEEIYTVEKKVAPGWTFCKSSRKYYPNDKAFKIDTSTCIKFNINILSGRELENRKQFSNICPLDKDLTKINCNNALFVKGIKIMEIKGSNIVAHDQRHTVVAVNHKYSAYMLLIFKNKIEDNVKKQTEESLLKMLYENSECTILNEVFKTFSFAYIYENLYATSVIVTDIEESITKFCHFLRNYCVSKVPRTVLLEKPNQLTLSRSLTSGQNINRNGDSSIMAHVSHEKDLTVKRSDQQRSFHKRSVSPEESLVPQRLQKLVNNSGTCQAQPPHINVQEEHFESPRQRQPILTSCNGTHPAHSQHRHVQEVHTVTKEHGQQALTSSSGTHPAHFRYKDVQEEHIVTTVHEQQPLTSSSDTYPAHPHQRDVKEEHIVTKGHGQQALTSSNDTYPAHPHQRDVKEEHIVTTGYEQQALTSSNDNHPAHPHYRDVQEEHIVTKGHEQQALPSSNDTHPPHLRYRDVQEEHIVTKGHEQQALPSSNDTRPAHLRYGDVQEEQIVTKGHKQQALTSSNDTHPTLPHYRAVQEEHIETTGHGQQALTNSSDTHPAHPHYRAVQEEHIVTKEQGYHTVPSSSGTCQTDYDHADVQRHPLILSGLGPQTFAYICGTCQAHNLHRDIQAVQESLVCSQNENQTIACSNASCLGHSPQRTAQEELIFPKGSSNCCKTILPKVTVPSNSSCSEAQVKKSYRTSQNTDCSEYIMKDSDMSVSKRGETDSQNIMKDSDMSASHKRKTDSQSVTKDSDVTISKNGKNNNRNLQETNGRSQKMTKSHKKGNSETKDNSRPLSAQNQKDYSTLTDRKGNASSKNIIPHIMNPVKSQKDPSGMERKFYGNFISNLKEKVVILLGASGSGKTTLVNFIANYFQGAKAADDVLVYVDANSSSVKPTTTITAYTFCNDENHAPITVIDTPGLNDSSRKEVDDNMQLIKQFLANAASHKIDIHAIGFVVQAHLVRLTSSERLILDYVSSLFGQSVANHLITFVTAADNQEIPPVVEAMRNCNIKLKTFFKFNNSAINNIVQEIDDFDKLYWRMGYKSWKKCLKLLLDLPQLSVNTFKALQNKVYSGKVIESAARDLQEELENFVHLCKDHKYMTKEAFEKCGQVWEQAVMFNHLKCTQESGVSDVESILKSFAIKVCMGNSFNSNECIDLLFLGGSKGILAAGMGVISSMGPLYENAKKYHNPKHDDKQVPSILHCVRCKDDHQITREVYVGLMSYIPGLGKSREIITFKCSTCDCDGSLHKDMAGGKSLASFDLSSQLLLKNTKIVITKLLQEISFPGFTINQDKYLHLINIALDCKFKIFIEELLKS